MPTHQYKKSTQRHMEEHNPIRRYLSYIKMDEMLGRIKQWLFWYNKHEDFEETNR